MKFSTATALAVYLSGGVLAAPAKDATEVAAMKMKAARDTSRVTASQREKDSSQFADDDDMQSDADAMLGNRLDGTDEATDKMVDEDTPMIMRRKVMEDSIVQSANSKRGYPGYPGYPYPGAYPGYPVRGPSYPATFASILQPVGSTNLKARDTSSANDAELHQMNGNGKMLTARAESNSNAAAKESQDNTIVPVYAPILTPLGQPPVPAGYPVYRRHEHAVYGGSKIVQGHHSHPWSKMARGESADAAHEADANAVPTNEKVFTPVLAPVLTPLGGPAYPQAYGPSPYYRRDEASINGVSSIEENSAKSNMDTAGNMLMARDEAADAGVAKEAGAVPTNEKNYIPTYASLLQPVGETWLKARADSAIESSEGAVPVKMVFARAEEAIAGPADKDVFMPTLAPILQPVGETWVKRDSESNAADHDAMLVGRSVSAEAASAQGAGARAPAVMNRVALVATNQAASVPVSAKFAMANQGQPVAYAKYYHAVQAEQAGPSQ
ncbi:hypothetical protein HIM_05088 [Hirsutella minnesotensis 3608]|uniref:Uncharacterized protein n=1 Tax=Hirsutella minnesotensis 3608 TaxID=1043627 RepID=A0A0F7ZPJ8_9HYPO|nr:hypothetical protein HIM_05088 [Hirsutella minnesotensis 3608]